MKCHYEVLGIPRDATVDVVKKAYRKLALEWHPDKNLHRTEEATETFQLIQQAYDILVDPQERAWYDRNRDKILRGDEDYVDDQLDVYQYFNTSKFKGYGDDDKSFYTVYREVFEKIVAEDKPFMDDDTTVPGFGYSYSPYKEEVYPFYAYWQSYCTAKPYSWVDKFDLAEARRCAVGRQVIRSMERENKKLRELHKKTRNEEIRQLVAFAKKRDKRIEDYKKLMEKQNAEKAKKAEEQRRKQIAERKKHLENYKESEWISMSSLESNLTEIEAHLDCEFGAESSSDRGDDSSSSSDVEDLYCVACDKVFRSTKAMTNHQKSKKHRENVASLKEYMENGDANSSDLEGNIPKGDLHGEVLKSEDEQGVCDEPKQTASKRKKKKKNRLLKYCDVTEETLLCFGDFVKAADEYFVLDGESSEALTFKTVTTDYCEENSISDSVDAINTKIKGPQQKASKQASTKSVGISKQDNKQHVPVIGQNIDRSHLEGVSHEDNCDTSLSSQHETQDGGGKTSMPEERKSKSAQRKARKKTAMNIDEEAQQVVTTCVKCGKVFGSRNRLFDHLKETGHSTFLSDKERASLKLKKKKET